MQQRLRFVLAQQNFTVGAIEANRDRIIEAIFSAQQTHQADVIVFPELALTGYPPEDLLFRKDFLDRTDEALQMIMEATEQITVVLGHPQRTSTGLFNAASVIQHGRILTNYFKQCLPNTGVFDERRYFLRGERPSLFSVKNVRIGLLICEDLWYSTPLKQTVDAGAQMILSLNASPFDTNKAHQREALLRQHARKHQRPIIYVHQVGGQDEIVFDGGSMVVNAQGNTCQHLGFFNECVGVTDCALTPEPQPQPMPTPKAPSPEALMYEALVLGLRDYVEKNQFPGVLIGLSGGIDSALTAAIAVDALGHDRVEGIILPSRYTSEMSFDCLQALLGNLHIPTKTLSIEDTYSSLLEGLNPLFENRAPDTTEENLQARCRGIIMMALSNKLGKMVITTGNKSEMAVGYATLYGDMCGGFALLKDVYKTDVYALSNYRNTISPTIPQRIIHRAPSAELADNQTDQDSLPPYDALDRMLALFIENNASLDEIVAEGFDRDVVAKVIRLVERNEYKRRQAPPGPRVTTCAFGRERRYPITSGFSASVF